LETTQKNDPQKNQPKESMGAIAIIVISKTPLASFLGNPSVEIVYLDSLEPVVEETPSLGEYFFSPDKKIHYKGKSSKKENGTNRRYSSETNHGMGCIKT
jgi:hypothetical protein